MGYIPPDTSKKPEAFRLQKFDIDMHTLKAVCPAGKESFSSGFQNKGKMTVSFSRATCKDCTFYQECVGQSKVKKRVLCVAPSYEYVLERRGKQKTESFKSEMSVRAQVEGTISEGVRFCGLRHAKYKGEDGHKCQFYMTGAALNVKRFIKAITKGIEIPRKISMVYKT